MAIVSFTHTFFPSNAALSFTKLVTLTDSLSVSPDKQSFIIGPAVNGSPNAQGVYIQQTAGNYRWLFDHPMDMAVSALTTYNYRFGFESSIGTALA